MLLQGGDWVQIAHHAFTALVGVYLLTASLLQWFPGPLATVPRMVLLCASVLPVAGGLVTDLIGLGLVVAL